jgi:hypothetical protein
MKLAKVLLEVYDVKVGCGMSCLNEFSVEELAHLIEVSKMQLRSVNNSSVMF